MPLSIWQSILDRLLRVPEDQRVREKARGERVDRLKADAQFVHDRLSSDHIPLDRYEEDVIKRLQRIDRLGTELMDTQLSKPANDFRQHAAAVLDEKQRGSWDPDDVHCQTYLAGMRNALNEIQINA